MLPELPLLFQGFQVFENIIDGDVTSFFAGYEKPLQLISHFPGQFDYKLIHH